MNATTWTYFQIQACKAWALGACKSVVVAVLHMLVPQLYGQYPTPNDCDSARSFTYSSRMLGLSFMSLYSVPTMVTSPSSGMSSILETARYRNPTGERVCSHSTCRTTAFARLLGQGACRYLCSSASAAWQPGPRARAFVAVYKSKAAQIVDHNFLFSGKIAHPATYPNFVSIPPRNLPASPPLLRCFLSISSKVRKQKSVGTITWLM